MMKRAALAAIATATLAAAGGAVAADKETVLATMQMPVMVNQGQNYVQATESMQLYPGDQLMVMKGGSAQVHYANGCVQTISANEIARVGTPESCVSLSSAGTHQQLGTTGTSGGGGGGGPQGVEWVGLGFIAGTGGYIVYKAADDDDTLEVTYTFSAADDGA